MQRKFYLSEVPDEMTVMQYIGMRSGFYDVARRVPPKRRYPEIMVIRGIEVDAQRMANCLKEVHEKFGIYPWTTAEGPIHGYRGFSLVYNPNHQDNLDVHQATLGTPKNTTQQFYWSKVETHRKLKHSYFDCYAFRKPTPASQHGYLGELISQFKLSRVRSRVATLYAQYFFEQTGRFQFGWHRDEIVFENLRMNIPVTTAPEFKFQHEPNGYDMPHEGKPGLMDIHLQVGNVYSWDTNKPHRVYCAEHTSNERTHIVLGFSPWIDYLPDEEAWQLNDFFGQIHPFDMIQEGYVHPTAYIDGV